MQVLLELWTESIVRPWIPLHFDRSLEYKDRNNKKQKGFDNCNLFIEVKMLFRHKIWINIVHSVCSVLWNCFKTCTIKFSHTVDIFNKLLLQSVPFYNVYIKKTSCFSSPFLSFYWNCSLLKTKDLKFYKK